MKSRCMLLFVNSASFAWSRPDELRLTPPHSPTSPRGHLVRGDQALCLLRPPELFLTGSNTPDRQCTSRYSIFTDSHFWGERGISIVSTQDVIDTAFLEGLNRYYEQNVLLKVAQDAFKQRRMEGKGVGLVAARALRKGELIIWEPPSLLVHLEMREHVSESVRMGLQRAAVDALPLTTKLETLGLMGHWGGDAIEDRLDTNSFTVTLEKPMDHHALFTQTSRLNHACRPNCFYQFDRRSLTHRVYTIQDIEPGQELTISYLEPVATYDERQQMIQNWGFNCSCAACTLPDKARQKSDASIQLIRQYTQELDDWSNRSLGSPQMAEELIELYNNEGLFSDIAEGYRLASLAYSAVKDGYNALRMAHNAIGFGLQTWREMGMRMNETLQFMMDPEAHWTWGKRL